MPSDDLGREHAGSLVGTLCSAVSTRAVKAEIVFHLLCFGDFKMGEITRSLLGSHL